MRVEADIARLLELRWWDWSDDELKAAMPLLTDGDISALYRHWQTAIKPLQ